MRFFWWRYTSFLNLIVIGVGCTRSFDHPELLANWKTALFTHKTPSGRIEARSLVMVVALSLLVFPKLALGFPGLRPAWPSCRW